MQRARRQRPEPLSDRLLLTESIFAALFVVAAIALIEIGDPGHVPIGAAIVLTIAFALLSRFEFETGAGTRRHAAGVRADALRAATRAGAGARRRRARAERPAGVRHGASSRAIA